MDKPRIYSDFNNYTSDPEFPCKVGYVLRSSHPYTFGDLAKYNLALADNLELLLYDIDGDNEGNRDDLEQEVICHYCKAKAIWLGLPVGPLYHVSEKES